MCELGLYPGYPNHVQPRYMGGAYYRPLTQRHGCLGFLMMLNCAVSFLPSFSIDNDHVTVRLKEINTRACFLHNYPLLLTSRRAHIAPQSETPRLHGDRCKSQLESSAATTPSRPTLYDLPPKHACTRTWVCSHLSITLWALSSDQRGCWRSCWTWMKSI